MDHKRPILIAALLITALLQAAPAQSERSESVVIVKRRPGAAVAKADRARERLARRTLEASFAASREIDPQTSVRLQSSLCVAAGEMRQKDLSKRWCEEVFRAAQQTIDAGELRMQIQMRALQGIADADPEQALEWLLRADMTPNEPDLRMYAARKVFAAFAAKLGPKSYPQIRDAAVSLGENGAFPYNALLEVTPAFRGNPDHCDEMLQQATKYVRAGSNADDYVHFADFVNGFSRQKCGSEPLLQEAAGEIATRLLRQLDQVAADPASADRATLGNLRALYWTSHRILEQRDPALARELARRYEPLRSLRPAADKSSSGASPERIQRRTPANDAETTRMRESLRKVSIAINRGNTDGKAQTSEMEQMIASGIDLGVRYITRIVELNPDRAHEYKAALANLGGVIEAGMRFWPEATLRHAEGVYDAELRANLLLRAAQSLGREQRRQERRERRRTARSKREAADNGNQSGSERARPEERR